MSSIYSSQKTECQRFQQQMICLCGEGLCFQRSRGANKSTDLSCPPWNMMKGRVKDEYSLLTSSIALRTAEIEAGTSPDLQQQGSFLMSSSQLYFVTSFEDKGIGMCTLGIIQVRKLFNFFKYFLDWQTSLSAGASKTAPAYFQGSINPILKTIVPPKLDPLKNAFGFLSNLERRQSTNASPCLALSQREVMSPLHGPSDLPKFI